jgi:signal transduction histidine kinase
MRRRLALLVAATTSVVLLAFLIPAAVLVSRAAASSAVSDATARSQSVVSAVAAGAGDDEIDALVDQLAAEGLAVTVSEESGATTRPRATVTRTGDGAALLRQPVLVEGRMLVVETVVPREQLREGVSRAWAVLGLLGLVLIGLSLLVADRLARTITRPITDLARGADRLAHGDLTTRVRPDGPAEVREVGAAINLLAGRIGELLAGERESVADLSHRLRTPVTVLRLEVESLAAGQERDRLSAAVDELARQVDGLIREARRPVREGVEARADAREVVAERVAFWSALAEDQGREVTLHLPETSCPVRATPADLEAALDALLGNVVAHTPEGTGLSVAVGRDGHDGVLVVVSDEGPGFADDDVVRRGESRAGSTGLGLDIARRTAAASGGDLRIGSAPGGGARVSMRLGPPATAD